VLYRAINGTPRACEMLACFDEVTRRVQVDLPKDVYIRASRACDEEKVTMEAFAREFFEQRFPPDGDPVKRVALKVVK
jgi:hypothetical protein